MIMITGSEGRIAKEIKKVYPDAVPYDLKLGDDIGDVQKLKEKMVDVGTVIHLAAHPHPNRNLTLEDYMNNNVWGTYQVLEAAYESMVERFIYASSTSYYGFEHGVEGIIQPAVETQAPATSYLRNINTGDAEMAYSISKVMAEQLVAWYGLQEKMITSIVRFGPLDCWTMRDSIVPIIERVMKQTVKYDVYNGVDKEVVEVDSSKTWCMGEP